MPRSKALQPGLKITGEGEVVPRWTTTDEATIKAYTELVDQVCPCVVLVHSQGGQFGQKVAQARPDLVKALVLVEPAGFGDPDKAGAQVDVIDLPEVDIKGNSHMMMMDRNNQQIAQLIQDWLQRKGLAD